MSTRQRKTGIERDLSSQNHKMENNNLRDKLTPAESLAFSTRENSAGDSMAGSGILNNTSNIGEGVGGERGVVAVGVVEPVSSVQGKGGEGKVMVGGRVGEAEEVNGGGIVGITQPKQSMHRGSERSAAGEVFQRISTTSRSTAKWASPRISILHPTMSNPAIPPCRNNSGSNTRLDQAVNAREIGEGPISPPSSRKS